RLQNDAENAARGAASQSHSGKVQEVFHARSAQDGNEQGSDGDLQQGGHQSRGRLHPAASAVSHLVWVVSRSAGDHRTAPRALVRLDYGFVGKGSLLHFAVAEDRKSTRLNSSHVAISYAVFCLKKKKKVFSSVPSIGCI